MRAVSGAGLRVPNFPGFNDPSGPLLPYPLLSLFFPSHTPNPLPPSSSTHLHEHLGSVKYPYTINLVSSHTSLPKMMSRNIPRASKLVRLHNFRITDASSPPFSAYRSPSSRGQRTPSSWELFAVRGRWLPEHGEKDVTRHPRFEIADITVNSAPALPSRL